MKRLTIIVFLCLFLMPISVMSIGDPHPDDVFYNFDRVVEHDNRQMVEIAFDEEGTGVYLEFECMLVLNMHLLNSTGRWALLNHQPWDSVNEIDLISRSFANISFILPYEDTFYLLFVNLNPTLDTNLIGWYAADESGPDIVIQGVEDAEYYNYKEKLDINCMFKERNYNITEVFLKYSYGYTLEQEFVNTLEYNWTFILDLNDFNENQVHLIFGAKDSLDNLREITIDIVLTGRPNTNTVISELPIEIFIFIFGLIGIAAIVAGVRYLYDYTKYGEEVVKPKGSGKKSKKRK